MMEHPQLRTITGKIALAAYTTGEQDTSKGQQ